MAGATVQIIHVTTKVRTYPLRGTWVYGKGSLNALTCAAVRVMVRDPRTGKEAAGEGQMTLSASWAFPSAAISLEEREAAMIDLVERYSRFLAAWGEAGHPLDLHFDSQDRLRQVAEAVVRDRGLAEPIPALARSVCASPFDLAVHDAFGRLHKASSYALLGAEHMTHDLGHYLGPSFAGRYPDAYLRRPPAERVTIAHTVAAADPLRQADVPADTPTAGDGLPQSLEAWIRREGVRTFKLKLTGDPEWDVQRTIDVAEIATATLGRNPQGAKAVTVSMDPNEQYPTVEAVVAMLEDLRSRSVLAWEALAYVEQPTPRDGLTAAVDHGPIAVLKPVIVDEGVTEPRDLIDAYGRGWSGVGLKACKGLSACVLFNAVSRQMDKLVTVQDLTTTGLAYLAGLGLAAHVDYTGGLESNGRQFAPDASEAVRPLTPGAFDVQRGSVDARSARDVGIGYGQASGSA